MSLNRNQMARTRQELAESLTRSGLSVHDVAAQLSWTPHRVEAALTLDGAHPQDVWLVRDLLDLRVREAEEQPVEWSALSEANRAAADGWFGLHELSKVLRRRD